MIRSLRLKYLIMALVRLYITGGTTEAIITSSTLPVSSPNFSKYWVANSPISSEVRFTSVFRRKLPASRSPS